MSIYWTLLSIFENWFKTLKNFFLKVDWPTLFDFLPEKTFLSNEGQFRIPARILALTLYVLWRYTEHLSLNMQNQKKNLNGIHLIFVKFILNNNIKIKKRRIYYNNKIKIF